MGCWFSVGPATVTTTPEFTQQGRKSEWRKIKIRTRSKVANSSKVDKSRARVVSRVGAKAPASRPKTRIAAVASRTISRTIRKIDKVRVILTPRQTLPGVFLFVSYAMTLARIVSQRSMASRISGM
jgi:hypothetical protein